MKQKIVALFDLDGVVLDTESQYSDYWGAQGKIYFPDTPNFAEKIKGNTLDTIFKDYFPNIEQQVAVKKSLLEFESQMAYPFIAGVKEFILMLGK